MDYLFSMGHTKIAYICGDSNSVTRQRLAAYYRSMEEHGITVPDEYVRPALYRDLTKAYELTEEPASEEAMRSVQTDLRYQGIYR